MRFLISLAAAFAISIAAREYSDAFISGWVAAWLYVFVDQHLIRAWH